MLSLSVHKYEYVTYESVYGTTFALQYHTQAHTFLIIDLILWWYGNHKKSNQNFCVESAEINVFAFE